jgi:hypothetical protein
MEQAFIPLLEALKEALRHRDSLSQLLLDDNISLHTQYQAVLDLSIQHRDLINQLLKSLSNTPAGYTPAAKEGIRTLVLILKQLNDLTSDW